MRHAVNGSRRGDRRRLAETFLPGQVMRLASASQHRLNPHIDTSIDVGRAKVTGIGQHSSYFAEFFWQRIQCRECGRELLFVIGCLDPVVSHHQHRLGIDRRLRVVTLLEAAARDRHNARVWIAQIDLVFGAHAGTRRRVFRARLWLRG